MPAKVVVQVHTHSHRLFPLVAVVDTVVVVVVTGLGIGEGAGAGAAGAGAGADVVFEARSVVGTSSVAGCVEDGTESEVLLVVDVVSVELDPDSVVVDVPEVEPEPDSVLFVVVGDAEVDAASVVLVDVVVSVVPEVVLVVVGAVSLIFPNVFVWGHRGSINQYKNKEWLKRK